MPRFRKRASVQDMAMNVLVKFFKTQFRKYNTEDSLHELRRIVAGIKTEIGPRIPWLLAADFYHRLLRSECWFTTTMTKIITQVIMDTKIVGLKLESGDLNFLSKNELSRIRGLAELKLRTNCKFATVAGLPLGSLQRLSCLSGCTDSDLEVIGQNCPRLEYLDVGSFEKVTDVGLRALSRCKNLSSVVASGGSFASSNISHLHSANEAIRHSWTRVEVEGFHFFSQASVCPLLEPYGIALTYTSNEDLRSIVVTFPNLTSLTIRIWGDVVGDLSILKSLSQLSRLTIKFDFGGATTWSHVESGLRSVVDKITNLSLRSRSVGDVIQSELNSIFDVCENLECLKFSYAVNSYPQKFIIPPFKNLKELAFNNHGKCQTIVEFSEMLKIEEIKVRNSETTRETATSLIFDDTKYPNLEILSLTKCRSHYNRYYSGLWSIAQVNNLDIQIESTEPTAACGEHHVRPSSDCMFCPRQRRQPSDRSSHPRW